MSIYRFNRFAGLDSASFSLSDNEFTLTAKAVAIAAEDGVPVDASNPEQAITLTLSELKALGEFDDGAMLTFDANRLGGEAPIEWKNLFLGTYVGRRSVREYLNTELKWNAAFRILIPAGGITSMRQCEFLIAMNDATTEIQTGEQLQSVGSQDEFVAKHAIPTIVGSSTIPANGSENYEIRLTTHNGSPLALSGTVYLEATAGALNRTRVPLVDGVGSFTFSATGLSPSDSPRIKSGFRYFAGASDKTLQVI